MRLISRTRRLAARLSLVALTALAIFILGEVVLRIFSPQEYLYPRYKYSPEYGGIVFPNRTMEHVLPGKFSFRYTVNENGHRGRALEPADHYETPNIVVLGDSYAFGMGVNDGEEFPWVLEDELDGDYHVLNLGNPGWGLTQQIRRYYEFAGKYDPQLVVLQFCANDPEDNISNMVTKVENGGFGFPQGASGINWVKKYLSESRIQKSQLYNFFRGRAYVLVKNLLLRKKEAQYEERSPAGEGAPRRERLYCSLLETFCDKLADTNTRLVMIAVNGQLERFPTIGRKVAELDAQGKLDYIEVTEWFEGVTDYKSPEGHVWGAKAHRIIAEGLADSIRAHHGGAD